MHLFFSPSLPNSLFESPITLWSFHNLLYDSSYDLSLVLHLMSPLVLPPPTPGHLLRDRLCHMCSGGPAVRRPHADSGALLLHVSLLWQLRRRDAPAPEEERRLPAWPVGNITLLHLAGHHVSVTHAQVTCIGRERRNLFARKRPLSVCAHADCKPATWLILTVLHSCIHAQTHSRRTPPLVKHSHQPLPSPMLFAIYSKVLQ